MCLWTIDAVLVCMCTRIQLYRMESALCGLEQELVKQKRLFSTSHIKSLDPLFLGSDVWGLSGFLALLLLQPSSLTPPSLQLRG